MNICSHRSSWRIGAATVQVCFRHPVLDQRRNRPNTSVCLELGFVDIDLDMLLGCQPGCIRRVRIVAVGIEVVDYIEAVDAAGTAAVDCVVAAGTEVVDCIVTADVVDTAAAVAEELADTFAALRSAVLF